MYYINNKIRCNNNITNKSVITVSSVTNWSEKAFNKRLCPQPRPSFFYLLLSLPGCHLLMGSSYGVKCNQIYLVLVESVWIYWPKTFFKKSFSFILSRIRTLSDFKMSLWVKKTFSSSSSCCAGSPVYQYYGTIVCHFCAMAFLNG